MEHLSNIIILTYKKTRDLSRLLHHMGKLKFESILVVDLVL